MVWTSSLRQMYFSTGLKGIAVEAATRVENLIMETLGQLCQAGIDAEMVTAAMNTVEFRLRENNTGNFPRGLSLMLRALTTWLHGGDPTALLAYGAPLAAIKGRLAKGERLFEELIQEHLLANPHRTRVSLKPDPEVGLRREQAEKERLSNTLATLSTAQLEGILAEASELKRLQQMADSPEALATIPTLELADLDRENKQLPIEVEHEDGCQLIYHNLFTNGIVYLDVGFNLHNLAQDWLPYAPLIGRALCWRWALRGKIMSGFPSASASIRVEFSLPC